MGPIGPNHLIRQKTETRPQKIIPYRQNIHNRTNLISSYVLTHQSPRKQLGKNSHQPTSIIRLNEKPKKINYSLKIITDSSRKQKPDTLQSNNKISTTQSPCSYTNNTESRSQKTSTSDKQHQLTALVNLPKFQLNN